MGWASLPFVPQIHIKYSLLEPSMRRDVADICLSSNGLIARVFGNTTQRGARGGYGIAMCVEFGSPGLIEG